MGSIAGIKRGSYKPRTAKTGGWSKWAFEPIKVERAGIAIIGFVPNECDHWDYSHPLSGTITVKIMPNGKATYMHTCEQSLALNCGQLKQAKELAIELLAAY